MSLYKRSYWFLIAGLTGSLVLAGCATSKDSATTDRTLTVAPAGAKTDTALRSEEPPARPGAEQVADDEASAAEPQPQPAATRVALKPGHPTRYTVRAGDTLWDISERFLLDPWLWPEIWYVNPQVRNPHLIYPGDVLELFYTADGKPKVRVVRGRQTIKLSPEIRVESIKQAIPTIPLDKIIAFLNRTAILSAQEWQALPYIFAQRDGLLLDTGNLFYAENLPPNEPAFSIFREDQDYADPVTGEYLGTQGLFMGSSRLQRPGEPATLVMTSSRRAALPGDRLYAEPEQELPASFQPRAGSVNGVIISVLDGVSQIGQYQNVVINRGRREGAAPGDVLGIVQTGEVAFDPYDTKRSVILPNERAGLMIVYKVFDKVSYGLIVRARRVMHVGDAVAPPQISDL
jgi:LysM repeat protein